MVNKILPKFKDKQLLATVIFGSYGNFWVNSPITEDNFGFQEKNKRFYYVISMLLDYDVSN